MSRKSAIPNILTMSRIASVPVMIWGILALSAEQQTLIGQPFVLLTLFILACLTDYLDGYLARKWNVTSDFGRMIDPIADKLLISGCLIAFAIILKGAWIILIPAIIIIWRDIFISGLREHAALSARVLAPTRLAKWKTAIEMLALATLIIWISLKPVATESQDLLWSMNLSALMLHLGLALLWLAAVLSAYTGLIYTHSGLQRRN